jgi:dTDP-4-dehydrorhamnose reductase
MNILITGSNGQLGSELKSLSGLFNGFSFFFTDVDELDITNTNAVEAFVVDNEIDVVVNCAAYTAVDRAEEEQQKAHRINVEAVRNLALACNNRDALLVQISTDYVFNGKNYKPYVETDFTNPQSVYARTKLDAENMVEEFASRGIVIRTSWLYSSYGHNFVKTMLKYGRERDSLNVVFDQIGTPTYAKELASAILKIVNETAEYQGFDVFHFSNEGVCSWYDFAVAIMEESDINCQINPILTKDYPLPAPRPFYSVLDKSKIKDKFALTIPHWRESLKECLKKINN